MAMLKAVKLKLIEADTVAEFETSVNRQLTQDGWTLHGELHVTHTSIGIRYAQAMVKIEPVEVPGMSPLAMGGPMPMGPGGPVFIR